jgi:predicted HTH transcriptional regulator
MAKISDPSAHILSLIKNSEGAQIEFKRTAPAPLKMAKEMAAMANTLGGNILIGVDDGGAVVGIDDAQEEKELIMKAGRNHCVPPIEPEIKEIFIIGKTVLWVVITPGTERHAVLDQQGNTRVYVRVADKNLPASKKTARRLQDGPAIRLSRKKLDRHEMRLLDYLAKHQKVTLQEFCEQANISRRRAARILVKLEKAALIRSHDFDKNVFYTLNPKEIGNHRR